MYIGGERMYNYYSNAQRQQHHLAWHETLELHEIVAFQSIGLMKLKKSIGKITCPTLKGIYATTIKELEANLQELLKFYSMVPRIHMDSKDPEKLFYAGDLLTFLKAGVRNFAVAITETATPQLREVLAKQLQAAVNAHARIYNYMYQRGYYPSYNLEELLSNDVMMANKAMEMKY
jgi:spore coat protein F